MKKYVVKFIDCATTDEIEEICNDMYINNYRLVSTILEGCTVYFIFELDEVERRCN